jgi:hypothetical protein
VVVKVEILKVNFRSVLKKYAHLMKEEGFFDVVAPCIV